MNTSARELQKLAPNCLIVETSAGEHVNSTEGAIVFEADVIDMCPALEELENNIIKRMSKKSKSKHTDLGVVTLYCICTRDYSLNDVTLTHVSYADMCGVWNMLDTISTASSPCLRNWIRSILGTRCYDGFVVSASSRAPQNSNNSHGRGTDGVCISVSPPTQLSFPVSSFRGVRDAMMYDAGVLSIPMLLTGVKLPSFDHLLD